MATLLVTFSVPHFITHCSNWQWKTLYNDHPHYPLSSDCPRITTTTTSTVKERANSCVSQESFLLVCGPQTCYHLRFICIALSKQWYHEHGDNKLWWFNIWPALRQLKKSIQLLGRSSFEIKEHLHHHHCYNIIIFWTLLIRDQGTMGTLFLNHCMLCVLSPSPC